MADSRYALYFAPVDQPKLWDFGCRVIGYDAARGRELATLDAPGFTPERWAQLTAEPRRYGFHATLKAPFRLAEGCTEMQLCSHSARFAEALAPVALGPLRVQRIGSFFALTPSGDPAPVNALAARIVAHFEPFRAPLSATDMERRLRSPLTERQKDLLERYGYPFVGDEFRFHMTLTGRVDDATEAARAEALLNDAFARQVGPEAIWINALSILRQDGPDQPFRLIDQCRFTSERKKAS